MVYPTTSTGHGYSDACESSSPETHGAYHSSVRSHIHPDGVSDGSCITHRGVLLFYRMPFFLYFFFFFFLLAQLGRSVGDHNAVSILIPRPSRHGTKTELSQWPVDTDGARQSETVCRLVTQRNWRGRDTIKIDQSNRHGTLPS